MISFLKDLPRLDENNNRYTVVEFGCGCPFLAADIANCGFNTLALDHGSVITAISKLLPNVDLRNSLHAVTFEACDGSLNQLVFPDNVIAAFDTTGIEACGQNFLKALSDKEHLEVIVMKAGGKLIQQITSCGFKKIFTNSYAYNATGDCNKTWVTFQR